MNVYDSYYLFKILSEDTYDIAKYFVNNDNKIGGEKSVEVKFTYKNMKFMFFKTKHKNSREFHLYPENNEERSDYCVFIIIDLKENFIRLDTIAYNSKCFDGNFWEIHNFSKNSPNECLKNTHYGSHKELCEKNKCNGTFILKMALSFIKQINKGYKMKYVTLKDNAFKNCNNDKISVGKMHILLDGNTWYGKYGFVPKKDLQDKIDDKLLLKYKNNVNIINDATVANVDLQRYMKNIFTDKKNREYFDYINVDLKFMLKMVDKYKNEKISTFLKKLLETYDDGCYLFYLIYEDIFDDLNLYNFHGKPFIKMLD